MNAPQHSTSEQPLPRGANAAAQPLHVRQREMVLASLFARPAAKAATHRRWA